MRTSSHPDDIGTGHQVRAYRGGNAVAVGSAFVVFAIALVPGLVITNSRLIQVQDAIVIAIFGVLALRGFRSGLVQTENRFVVRALHRSYSIERSMVTRFLVERNAASPLGRRSKSYLKVELRNGRDHTLKSLGSDLQMTRGLGVADVAHALNASWSLARDDSSDSG